jgi:hypothetical protein
MTALAAEKQVDQEKWRYREFTATGSKIWKGAQVGIFLSGANAGKVGPMLASRADQKYIGRCWRTVDASAADAIVTIRFDRDLELEWMVNDTSVLATHVGQSCYAVDDQTVGIAGTLGSPLGTIYAVDATLGVLVKKVEDVAGIDYPNTGVVPAFAAGAAALTMVVHDAVYGIPTTAANSTITLPAPATLPIGLRAYFVANGVKNGHTIQFLDATGAVALNTATTASKRFLAIATVGPDQTWAVAVTVAP